MVVNTLIFLVTISLFICHRLLESFIKTQHPEMAKEYRINFKVVERQIIPNEFGDAECQCTSR